MSRTCTALFAVSILAAFPAAAKEGPEIPEVAAALLKAAYESGDKDEIAAVARAVKKVFPDYAAAIDENVERKLAELDEKTPPEAESVEGASPGAAPPPGPIRNLIAVRPWEGKISASGVFASGNSDNAAVGVALDAVRTDGEFTHNMKGFFDLGESNGETNQKRWGASYKLDYNFSDRTYAYGRVSYEEDEFSGFDYRIFSGAGLGNYFAKSEAFILKMEAGPGFRYSPVDDTREVESEFAAYAASELDWLISEGVKFEQDVSVTWTQPTTTIQSVSSLTTQIWGDISTGLSFEYRYETDPPLGRENADAIAKASLIYGF